MAAHWRDGNRWLWPSSFGPVAPSLVVVLMPQDGKDTHTLCSMRSGAPILSPSVPRGMGKSFKCGESLPPELVTKHIGKIWKGSFAANKRACLRFFPDGKSHRTSYEYWNRLELMFPGAYEDGNPLVPMSAYTCEPLRQQLCHNVPQWWTQCVSLVSMDACETIQHQGCVFCSCFVFGSIAIFYLC